VIDVRVRRLRPEGRLPQQVSAAAAGYDLYAAQETLVPARGRVLVPTAIAIALPPGYEAQVRPRSGLALHEGITAHFGTIDPDYRGEILVLLHSQRDTDFTVKAGERVAQLVLAPIVRATFSEGDLDATERGEGGFGHSGR
jgi:deoxyuridine 5'-triphosphate nucleotidohydrolase